MGQKKMNEMEHVTHEFQPIYDKDSKVLMLGTMPSPKSREVGFYYGHPRNRFWKVVSDVCGEALPETKEEKIAFALRNHTGQKAAQLYKRYCQKETGREIICLPSTSPANCRVHYEELYEAYKVIRDYI